MALDSQNPSQQHPQGAPQGGAPRSSWFGSATRALNILGTLLILVVAIAVNADVTGRNLFNHPLPGVLEFIGLSGSDHAYLWIHDVDSRYGRFANDTFSDVNIALLDLKDGLYLAEFYETRGPGGVIRTTTSSSRAGRLPLTLPDFTRDIALKVKPLSKSD